MNSAVGYTQQGQGPLSVRFGQEPHLRRIEQHSLVIVQRVLKPVPSKGKTEAPAPITCRQKPHAIVEFMRVEQVISKVRNQGLIESSGNRQRQRSVGEK